MDLKILPTKTIINTYKRYSLPVPEAVPTDVSRLQFFYIGTQTRSIEKLKEYFEFGYTTISAESAIFTMKRLFKNPSTITIPDMIIAEGTLGAEQLIELHKFIYAHKIMAAVPFIVEATGLSNEALTKFKRYTFIDEMLFLNEFTAPALLRKVNFLKQIKQKWINQFAACQVETSFRTYPDARALVKRGLDLLISSVLMAVLGPVILLIALAVKFDTGGPVLYTTLRTGRGYRIFNLYKFNTIIQDDNNKKNGADISRAGAFLRKTGLDELPVLLNVWLGDLSLVGHRAMPLYEAERYTTNTGANHFLSVAGITGWQTQKNGQAAMPVDAPLVAGAGDSDKSDLLYDIWLMANKPPAIAHKTNA